MNMDNSDLEFKFDDGSTFQVEKFKLGSPHQRAAFDAVFGNDETPWREWLQRYFEPIVDYFWEAKRIPDKRGDEIEWPRTFESKEFLAAGVLGGILGRALVAKAFPNLIYLVADPEAGSTESLRGEKAFEAAVDSSRQVFLWLMERALARRATILLKEKDREAALDDLRMIAAIHGAEPAGARTTFKKFVEETGDDLAIRETWRAVAENRDSPHLDSVTCPECGWVPDGKPRWVCDACRTKFDTFTTRASCPKCGKSREETGCPACNALTAHARWWI